MNSFTLRFRKLWSSAQSWSRDFSPKLELWIDKYKLIKVGCVLGISTSSISKFLMGTISTTDSWKS